MIVVQLEMILSLLYPHRWRPRGWMLRDHDRFAWLANGECVWSYKCILYINIERKKYVSSGPEA